MSDKLVAPFSEKKFREAALLSLDLDENSDRFIVINRVNVKVLNHGKTPLTNIKKILLPAIYASDNNIMVILLDDDRQFNAVVVDGISLESVNVNDVVL